MDRRKPIPIRKPPVQLSDEDRETGNLSNVRQVGALLHFEVQGFGRTLVVNSAEAVNLAAWLIVLAPDGEERLGAVLAHIKQHKAYGGGR